MNDGNGPMLDLLARVDFWDIEKKIKISLFFIDLVFFRVLTFFVLTRFFHVPPKSLASVGNAREFTAISMYDTRVLG